MWKCASRSLRTFKKSVLRCNTVLSTKPLQSNDLHYILKFSPILKEHCNRFYNIYKDTCENFTKEKEDKEGPKKKTSFLGGLENYFVDALTWSGALVLAGYYAVHYKRKRLFHIFDLYEINLNISDLYATTGYQKTFGYLINNAGIKPYNCVIPEVQAAKVTNDRQKTESQKSDEENFNGLDRAYQNVLGTLSNWLGAQCMQSGQHKEALKYFTQSAEEKYAPGIFNLGICHERGYGTSQNFKRAAEMYQKAADLGHASAMYNLGVFYAQGLGGIKPDLDHARELFKAAASLGQEDAVKALSLEQQPAEISEKVSLSKCKEKDGNTLTNLIFDNFLNQSSSDSLVNYNACDDELKSCSDSFDYMGGKELNLSSGSDSGVIDFVPHNESHTLLV